MKDPIAQQLAEFMDPTTALLVAACARMATLLVEVANERSDPKTVPATDDEKGAPMARDIGNGEYAENQIDTSARFYDGTLTATTTAQALGPETKCIELLIQVDPLTAEAGVRIGNSTSQSMYCAPGQERSIPVTDVRLVYVKAVAGTVRVNYWARGG